MFARRPLPGDTITFAAEQGIHWQTTLAVKESFAFRRLDDLSFLNLPLILDTSPPAFLHQLRAYAHSLRNAETLARRIDGFEVGMAEAGRLHGAGIMLVAGKDAPHPGAMLGEGLHRELELLVEAGVTPLETIRTATPASISGAPTCAGTTAG